MAELITEIAYGAHNDDEDGGHDYVQMQGEMGVITFKTVQGYWVDHFPWSALDYDDRFSVSLQTYFDSEAHTTLVPIRPMEARCVKVEQGV